jgi:hypothetical protein
MTIEWSEYLPEVTPDCPGVSGPMAENAVRNAAIFFARHSTVVRETQTAVDIVAAQSEYTIALPTGLRVVSPILVEVEGAPVYSISENELNTISPNWRNQPVRAYHMEDDVTLRLLWAPSAAVTGGLITRFSFEPTRDSTGGPDALYNDWLEVIAAGAKARLMRQNKKLWTDRRRSEDEELDFKGGIDRALGRAMKSRTNRPTHVQQRPMA